MSNKKDFNSASMGLLGLDKPTPAQSKAVDAKAKPAPAKAPKPTSAPQVKLKKENPAVKDIFSEVSAPTRRGRDITIYLNNDVLEAVTQISAQRGISKSKVINAVLGQILLDNRGA